MKNKFVIIDGNAIIHRAYHAIPPLTTKNGQIVNAVYGFTSMMLKVWNQLQPKYMVVSFDMAAKTFRHEKYADYKSTRVKADQELYDQIPLVHEVVKSFNIPIFEKEGFEADDVIGTIVRKILKQVQDDTIKEELEIYIVTGDMDALQLVDDDVRIFTMRKGINDIVIYDRDKVIERYGFGPESIIDYKALAGDSSDNIPGVAGVGQKTATTLIEQFKSLDKIYQAVDKDDGSIKEAFLKKLIKDRDKAFLSYELAEIDCAVPKLNFDLQKSKLSEYNKEKVLALFKKYEFVSLLKRVPGMDKSDLPEEKKMKAKKVREISYHEVDKVKDVKQIVAKIKSEGWFASQVYDEGAVVVVGSKGYHLATKYLPNLLPIFKEKEVELIGHDLKKLVKILNRVQDDKDKVEVKNRLFDVMIASYLLNPGTRAHDPASIVLKTLGRELPNVGQEGLFGLDTRQVAAELNLLAVAADKLKKELRESNNLGLLEKIEMPLITVLADMESNGVAIDEKMLQKMSVDIAGKIEKLTKDIHELAGEEFNVSSSQQLREILFEKMELPTQGIKKGKTGYSTDSKQLEKLHLEHPIIALIEQYRELSKLQNTYVDVLPTLADEKDGRIHTSYNQAVTATGRLSSSDPNLQNIPIRTEIGREIRKAFIAEDGYSLVVADYSQIELRIVASLAKDKKMMEIFKAGKDIHKATAAAINGVKLEEVTKEMRRAAKEVNFGVLYGMGSYGLSSRTGLPVWQAKEFIEKYFEQFKDVREYIDNTLEFTKKEGYCETLYGRRRYIPELNSHNFQVRSAAERMATNHPVQGTAADVMKMAMIAVHDEIKKKYSSDEVKLILQVHDELVLEVKKGLENKVSKLVVKAMEEVVKLNVPVVVDVADGKRWGEVK